MTTMTLWPSWLDDIWAKGSSDGNPAGESLAKHTFSVLRMSGQAYRLRKDLPRLANVENFWHCLFWTCWLHDFGKAAPGFQGQLRGIGRWPHRHEILSLAFLSWLETCSTPDELILISAGIAYHHRDESQIHKWYRPPAVYETLDDLFGSMGIPDDHVILNLYRWIDEYQEATVKQVGFPAGAGVRLADLPSEDQALSLIKEQSYDLILGYLRNLRMWSRRQKNGPYGSHSLGALALGGLVNWCDYTASAHVEQGTDIDGFSLGHLKKVLDPKVFESPYSHQIDSSKIDSGILVAPTGSGKTEAALIWACSQKDRGYPVSRIMYMLPYQASMNAMYTRLEKVFSGLIGLEHSRSMLALYRYNLEDGGDPSTAVRNARIQSRLTRLHCQPVKIMSPYQMLKAPYRLKGYELLLSDFVGSTVILDEIHAYEPQRLAQILATVKYLRETLGCRVFVMTATLPGILLKRLKDTLGEAGLVQADSRTFECFARHRLECVEGDMLKEVWLNETCRKAADGTSVLVCWNTVSRAQTAYTHISKVLKGKDVEVILLHGRFTGRDRLAKERRIQNLLGRNTERRKPVVLVATQVVEVSLDIDLDECYTDPAPLEALIQRFGRVNRQGGRLGLAPVKVFTLPDDGQGIYDKDLVQASVDIVRQNTKRPIREDQVSTWLNKVYTGKLAGKWEADFDDAYEMFQRWCIDTIRPFDSDPKLQKLFYQAFDGLEVVPEELAQEYNGLYDSGRPLEACALSVPISWKQYLVLQRKSLVNRNQGERILDVSGKLPIVKLPYSEEYGLELGR